MKLNHYVELMPVANLPAGPRFAVRFVVGAQSFPIGDGFETLGEAVWYRDQLLSALRVMVSEVTDS